MLNGKYCNGMSDILLVSNCEVCLLLSYEHYSLLICFFVETALWNIWPNSTENAGSEMSHERLEAGERFVRKQMSYGQHIRAVGWINIHNVAEEEDLLEREPIISRLLSWWVRHLKTGWINGTQANMFWVFHGSISESTFKIKGQICKMNIQNHWMCP